MVMFVQLFLRLLNTHEPTTNKTTTERDPTIKYDTSHNKKEIYFRKSVKTL